MDTRTTEDKTKITVTELKQLRAASMLILENKETVERELERLS